MTSLFGTQKKNTTNKYESGGESEQGNEFFTDFSDNDLLYVKFSLKRFLKYHSV